jgi:hypothetical protein
VSTISFIIPPPSTYQASAKTPQIAEQPKAAVTKSRDLDWEDYAAEEDWENAIVGLARSGWGKRFSYWRFVNQIVAESRQPTRAEVRRATKDVIKAVAAVVRARKITRYGRHWVGIEVGKSPCRNVSVQPVSCAI